jgi:UMF1 family MFS transporter
MSHVVVNAARPETREQRAWYWYDWANSAYVTTTATVLMSPYLTSVAEQAACPSLAEGQDCTANLSVLGIPVAPGSLWFFIVTFTTIL